MSTEAPFMPACFKSLLGMRFLFYQNGKLALLTLIGDRFNIKILIDAGQTEAIISMANKFILLEKLMAVFCIMNLFAGKLGVVFAGSGYFVFYISFCPLKWSGRFNF